MHKLGWSLQRRTLRARERDEDKILEWKKTTWEQVKKRPKSPLLDSFPPFSMLSGNLTHFLLRPSAYMAQECEKTEETCQIHVPSLIFGLFRAIGAGR